VVDLIFFLFDGLLCCENFLSVNNLIVVFILIFSIMEAAKIHLMVMGLYFKFWIFWHFITHIS
jgi:hypothetical protein